jgi:alpha-glucosidase
MGKVAFRSIIFFIIAGLGCSSAIVAVESQILSVSSPDGKLKIAFQAKSNPPPYLPGERAYYQLSYLGQTILVDSPLGLDFKEASALDRDLEIVGANRESNDSTWDNPFGPRRKVRDHYNQLTVHLHERHAPGRCVDLVFRAYDEGVAFRYALPQQDALRNFMIAAENTGFYFTRDASAWAIDLGQYSTPYEGEFRQVALTEIKPNSIIGLPLVVKTAGGTWVALLEADLTDYAGMYVSGVPGTSNALVSKLSPLPNIDFTLPLYFGAASLEDQLGKMGAMSEHLQFPASYPHTRAAALDDLVAGSTPKATPWRVLMVNPRAGGLIESSDLILNLSAPCALADISWIKPGKSAWDWWSGRFARDVNFQPGMNTATLEHYLDFAAQSHFQYLLIDSNWSSWTDITRPVPEVNLPEILALAKQKGVGVLLWLPWTATALQMDEAFPLYEKWGVAGVKVDLMNRDDQEMVNFLERVVRKAAEHHLVVDFHGVYKPTGLRRTYPNLLTREGVMGLEYDKGSDRVTPDHDVTIPFTRMLAGPMDFTPGGFRNTARGQFQVHDPEPMVQGTRAHQLAMYVVYESPLAMVSDEPEAYTQQPGFEFILEVPTVWEDTKVLNGEVGLYITVARKHGGAWYLGSMTNWEGRTLEIPLDFLGAGNFDAQVFSDGPGADRVATSVSILHERVNAHSKLRLKLASGGGATVIVSPAN